jgi:CRP/FNR family cyclic AMP-dependent transcriptional regulator
MLGEGMLWGELSPEIVSQIGKHAVRRTWAQNAYIFRQSEVCKGLHLLESGSVKLYVGDRSGREQTLHVQMEPGPLTLLPLLDGGTYAVSARAIVPSVTQFISRDQFDSLCTSHVDFAVTVSRELARRTRLMISIAGSVSLKPVASRVAIYIQEQARNRGCLENRAAFRLPLCQEELAHLAGTTRESVARALAELRDAGVIEQRGATVRVINLKELALYCGDESGPPVNVDLEADIDAA